MEALELKFRAYDKHKKKMMPEFTKYVVAEDGTEYNFPAFNFTTNTMAHDVVSLSEALSDPKRFEVMQFTGLYDRNNVPIYVGDILNWDEQESQPARSAVMAVPGGFVLADSLDGESGGAGGLWTNREVIENAHSVVGDIYEDEL